MRYKVVIQESEEGFAVSVPGLPGCHSQGATQQEALENVSQAIREYLDVAEELTRNSAGQAGGWHWWLVHQCSAAS